MTDPEVIILAVCEYFDVTLEELSKKDSSKPNVYYRKILMRMLRNYTALTFREIGERFNRNYSTVIAAMGDKKENPYLIPHYRILTNILVYDKGQTEDIIPDDDVLAEFFVFTSEL